MWNRSYRYLFYIFNKLVIELDSEFGYDDGWYNVQYGNNIGLVHKDDLVLPKEAKTEFQIDNETWGIERVRMWLNSVRLEGSKYM